MNIHWLVLLFAKAGEVPQRHYNFANPRSTLCHRIQQFWIILCDEFRLNLIQFADNFCNGETWQVGLRDYADAIDAAGGKLTLVVTPLRRGVRVKVTSSMAARLEQSDACVADVTDVYATPVYHMPVGK